MSDWRRHLFSTRTRVKTTWKLRIGVLIAAILLGTLTRDLWVGWIGSSLVCARDTAPSDLILIENFDPMYLLFERAEELEKAGLAPRVLVPVQALSRPGVANLVSLGFAEVMARHARIVTWDAVPIGEIEPITLNAALELRAHLVRERVRSVIVVTSGFRSRRSALVYGAVFGQAGIQVRCEPVFGPRAHRASWTSTWHGIETVLEELLKLQYYRFYVMPFRSGRAGVGGEH